MNRQEIFNKAVMGIINQGGPSYEQSDGSPAPLYHNGTNDRCCAMGHIVPKETAQRLQYDYDGINIRSIINDYDNIKELFDVKSYDDGIFLQNLQDLHDAILDNTNNVNDKQFMKIFKENAIVFAHKYNLNMPEGITYDR